jgi:hypothetical protein
MGIVFALKEGQGIIGVPEQGAIAPTVLCHGGDKPLIQDVIQEYIGDNRRDYSPNAKENFYQVGLKLEKLSPGAS